MGLVISVRTVEMNLRGAGNVGPLGDGVRYKRGKQVFEAREVEGGKYVYSTRRVKNLTTKGFILSELARIKSEPGWKLTVEYKEGGEA